MPFGRKYDYPPLLPPGRHYMDLYGVKARFIEPFNENARRRHLFQLLEGFIQAILVAGFPCEVWLDGSLLTEKPEPSDLDVTVILEPDVLEGLRPEQAELVDRIANAQMGDGIDSFAFSRLDRSNPLYGHESADPAHSWGEQYGLETSEQWLKGYVVLRLRETHVGLRICS